MSSSGIIATLTSENKQHLLDEIKSFKRLHAKTAAADQQFIEENDSDFRAILSLERELKEAVKQPETERQREVSLPPTPEERMHVDDYLKGLGLPPGF